MTEDLSKSRKFDFPKGIFDAAQNGELVLFVGAGVSSLLGCPSWQELSSRILEKLRIVGGLNYADLDALSNLDLKKQISIAKSIAKKREISLNFEELLSPDKSPDAEMRDLYRAIFEINSVIVTTNYDRFLDEICQRSGIVISSEEPPMSQPPAATKGKIFFKKEDLTVAKLHEPGTILHLHGSVSDAESMVLTTSDYILHYQNAYIRDFLKALFETKVVLFIGYGLGEEEILEYALRKRELQTGKGKEDRHFWLYPLLTRNNLSCTHLRNYFSENFGVQIVEYCIDQNGHEQLGEIIKDLANQLQGKVKKPVFSKEIKDALGDILK